MGHRKEPLMDYDKNGTTFLYLARCVMLGKGMATETQRAAEQILRTPEQTQMILRGAIAIGSIENATWGSQVAGYRQAVDGFIASIEHISIFDQLLAGGMRKLPLRSRIVVSTYSSPAQGYIVGESGLKPISRLNLTSNTEEPKKAVCLIVIAKELAENQAPGSAEFFATEMRQAVVTVTDLEFLTGILDSAPEIDATSQGGNVLDDIAALLDEVTLGANSRPYLVTTPQVAKWLSTRTDDAGQRQYPEMTPLGGMLAGMPVLVTDQLLASTDGERMALIDASSLGGNVDTMTLSSAEHATLELNDDPQGTADSAQTSLWQQNLLALRVERYFNFQKLRETGVAVLKNIDYSDHT